MSIMTYKNKQDTNKIKQDIDSYRADILEKHDLLKLSAKAEKIEEISGEFSRMEHNNIMRKTPVETELHYYGKIKIGMKSILNEIPEKYKEIRHLIEAIIKAVGYCITHKKVFSALDRDDIYSYTYVEEKFNMVIVKIDTVIRDM